MKPLQFTAPLGLICLVAALALFSACSTNPAPSIVFHSGNAPTGGPGGSPTLNRIVSFSIKIPPVPTGGAALRRTVDIRAATPKTATAAPTPQPTSIYLAPRTGSISIALVAVNGTSLSHPAPNVPPANVPSSCAPAGCTVTISGVPASDGVDRFAVVTYTGPNGGGSIISNGVVDVTVPTSTTTVVGGNSAALSVGGFVASLALSVTPTTFAQGSPATASVVVSAKDATGATIIGNALFASPIVLGISTTAGQPLHFSFAGGASTASVTMPLSSPIPLHYDGGSSGIVTIGATSVDGNGNAVNASPVPLTVSIGPGPSPSPIPTVSIPPGALSLYVLNGINNAVEEFPSPAPAATPKRSFGPTLAMLACATGAVPFGIGMVQGLVVDARGNTYVSNNPNCNTNPVPPFTAWQFASSATATSAPTATFIVPTTYNAAPSQNLGLDPTSQLVLMPALDASSGTPAVLRVAFSGASGAISSVLGGGACLPLIGFTTCDGTDQYGSTSILTIAVDSRGYSYLGGQTDLSGNPVILIFSPGATSPLPYSVIDGPQTDTELDQLPSALVVDGTTLYVLNLPSTIGFANCGPLNSPNLVCADGNPHEYVTAYDTTKLVAGAAVDLKPIFVLGGDSTGHFGAPGSAIAQAFANRMAVSKGRLYVANTAGPFCDTTCGANASSGTVPPPGEVDIYNVAGLTGAHSDIAPTIIIQDPSRLPAGVAIGPSGTATGPRIRAIRGIPGKYRARAGKPLQVVR